MSIRNGNLSVGEFLQNLSKYERNFYNYSLIKEGFHIKLQGNKEKFGAGKEKAFKLWFECVQYLSWKKKADQARHNGRITKKMLAGKKHSIMKMFVNQDGVYREKHAQPLMDTREKIDEMIKKKSRLWSKPERKDMAGLGVSFIKHIAFKVFRPDFERHVTSPGYKYMCRYCKKNYK